MLNFVLVDFNRFKKKSFIFLGWWCSLIETLIVDGTFICTDFSATFHCLLSLYRLRIFHRNISRHYFCCFWLTSICKEFRFVVFNFYSLEWFCQCLLFLGWSDQFLVVFCQLFCVDGCQIVVVNAWIRIHWFECIIAHR